MAQALKPPTLDFGSGHDLMVCWSLVSGSTVLAWSLLGILSLPLSALPLLALSLLSQKNLLIIHCSTIKVL